VTAGPVPRDPRLAQLLAYWEAARRGRPMPAVGEIALVDLGFVLPHLLWVEVEHAPRRYRYRRVGAELQRIYGMHLEGLYVDEMRGFRHRRVAGKAYDEVVDGRAPTCRVLAFSMVTWFARYERLLLPLSDTGERVDLVVGGIVPEFGPTPGA
jgi:hypothetical protein